MVLIHVMRPFQVVLIQMVRIHATVWMVTLRNLHWFALVRNSNVKSSNLLYTVDCCFAAFLEGALFYLVIPIFKALKEENLSASTLKATMQTLPLNPSFFWLLNVELLCPSTFLAPLAVRCLLEELLQQRALKRELRLENLTGRVLLRQLAIAGCYLGWMNCCHVKVNQLGLTSSICISVSHQ